MRLLCAPSCAVSSLVCYQQCVAVCDTTPCAAQTGEFQLVAQRSLGPLYLAHCVRMMY